MNSTIDADIAAFIEEQAVFVAQDYCTTAAAILLMWHYLLTFDKEVAYFWRRRPNGVCVMFLANRYLPLIVSIYNTPWWSLSTAYIGCAAAVFSQYVLELSQYVVWAVFACLRVYALRRQWPWAALVLVLSLAPVVTNAASLRFIRVWLDPATGCNALDDTPASLSEGLDIASRVSLIVADIIFMGMTWSVTHHHRRKNSLRRISGSKKTLTSILYNNGGIYFLLLTSLNALHLLFSMLSIALANTTTDRASFVVRFIEPLTAILITRFLIELQEATRSSGAPALDGEYSAFGAASDSGTLRFVRADVDSWVREECAPLPVVGEHAGLESEKEGEGTQGDKEAPEGVRPVLNRVQDADDELKGDVRV